MNNERYEQVRMLLSARRPKDAISLLEKELRLDPDDAQCHYLLVYCHMQLREHQEAEDAARRACSFDPHNGSYRVALAEALRFGGSPRAAKQEAEQAVALDPDHADAFYALACAETDLGNTDAALIALEGTLRLAPMDHRALALRSGILVGRNDLDGADKDVRAALRLDPGRASYLARKAWTDLLAGVGTDHIGAFHQALRQNPNDALARFGLLRALAPFPYWLAWSIRRANRPSTWRLSDPWRSLIGLTVFVAWSMAVRWNFLPSFLIVLPSLLWLFILWTAEQYGPDLLLGSAMLKRQGLPLSMPLERWGFIRQGGLRLGGILFALVVVAWNPLIGAEVGSVVALLLMLDRFTQRDASRKGYLLRLALIIACLLLTATFHDSRTYRSACGLAAAFLATPWIMRGTRAR